MSSWFTEFFGYIVNPFLLEGAWTAIKISAVAMVGGLILGLGLALLRLSRIAPLRWLAWLYIWFVRGTPQLLQLVFLYDVLPIIGIKLDVFPTAVIGFALNEAAFSAELIRGGILSVNRNQSIAASAFGMGPFLTLRRIILPQAMRAILPGMANDTISMIKGTSIASVIFVNELTFRSQQIVGQNFEFFQVFAAAGVLYLIMTSAVAGAQTLLERRFNFELERNSAERRLFGFNFGKRNQVDPATPRPVLSASAKPALDRDWLSTLTSGAKTQDEGEQPFVIGRNLWKSYGSREVLRGVDFTVRRGEVVVIMGPSGSGKSTLLRMVNHLESIDNGEILVDGQHVGYERINQVLKPIRALGASS